MVGHTIDLFRPVSVPAVFLAHCRLLFCSLLQDVQVDHKCNILTLDSFLFLCCFLFSCLSLCLLWLAVRAAIVVYLCPFVCCSYRSPCHIRSLFLCYLLLFFPFPLPFVFTLPLPLYPLYVAPISTGAVGPPKLLLTADCCCNLVNAIVVL